jgi:hypothetical protein
MLFSEIERGTRNPVTPREDPVWREETVAWTRTTLAGLGSDFTAWCTDLAASGVPEALDHADLHGGQIFAPGSDGRVFPGNGGGSAGWAEELAAAADF